MASSRAQPHRDRIGCVKALEHLMGAYFHQDWYLDGGTVADTLAAFAREPKELRVAAIVDIDALLARNHAEGNLADELHAMGCDFHAGDHDADRRAWLIGIRRQIKQAL